MNMMHSLPQAHLWNNSFFYLTEGNKNDEDCDIVSTGVQMDKLQHEYRLYLGKTVATCSGVMSCFLNGTFVTN